VNIEKPKKGDFGKGSMPFREIFVAFGSWEIHKRLSLCEQLG